MDQLFQPYGPWKLKKCFHYTLEQGKWSILCKIHAYIDDPSMEIPVQRFPPIWWTWLELSTVPSMTVEAREFFGPPQVVPREYGKSSSSPCPDPLCFRYLPMDAGIRIRDGTHEGQGHTQADIHDGFPGLFWLLQSPIDAYVDGRVVVRDSWKFLFCEMSGCGKKISKSTHTSEGQRKHGRPLIVDRSCAQVPHTHINTYRAPK